MMKRCSSILRRSFVISAIAVVVVVVVIAILDSVISFERTKTNMIK